jgi:hypothetical protein
MELFEITGAYGRYSDKGGVLVDHVERAKAHGFRVHESASGAAWIVAPDGEAERIVCGHIVETFDCEGFRGDGRCGEGAVYALGACAPHAEMMAEYLAQSEAERAYAERMADRA